MELEFGFIQPCKNDYIFYLHDRNYIVSIFITLRDYMSHNRVVKNREVKQLEINQFLDFFLHINVQGKI